MLRYASRIRILPSKKINSFKEHKCYQSSHGSKSSGSSNALYIGGPIAITFVGAIGYAAWSKDHQKVMQRSIPGARFILEPLLGKIVEEPSPIEKPKPKAQDEGLLKKKLEREKAKKEKEDKLKKEKDDSDKKDTTAAKVSAKSEDAKPSSPNIVPPPPPPTAPPPPSEEPKKEEKPSTEDSEASANAALSQILQDNMSAAQNHIQSALKSAEVAVQTVQKLTEKAYSAIDSEDGDKQLFAIASDLSKVKRELIKGVEEMLFTAKDAMANLQNYYTAALQSEVTKDNPELATAKEKLSEFSFLTNKINNMIAEALRNCSALDEFKDRVLEGKKQFEAELQSISPGVTLGEKLENLKSEELTAHLALAHNKILALQRHLAKQQILDKGHMKETVLRQRDQEARYIEGRLQAELERQRHELGMEYRRRLQQIKEDNESEMRLQLKRQAAAHTDHLSDVLHLQEQELTHKFQNKLAEELQREKDEYHRSLSKISGQLGGLKAAMKKRADIDKDAHDAHELWMACQSLKAALRIGKSEAKSWEEQLLPLQDRIDAVKHAVGENNPFADVVLSSIPELARKRGVYTEDALRERFIKVERVCKRVSMIGDNGGSLVRYLLSYIQSFLITNAFEDLPGKEVRDQEIALDKLDTYDLVARARYCLEKDDILQAIRYMNLLRGEPKNVAKDWINEARLTLEARLAADALMAHAAATGTRAL